MTVRLLERFRAVFEGTTYNHRRSTTGDAVAQFLYEDLNDLGRSPKLVRRIAAHQSVLNVRNLAHGIFHRRGDGSFGTLVPSVPPVVDPGFAVARGPIANIEVGVEVKVLAKAMIKQIDRVKNDLRHQARQFRLGGPRAITIGIVGVNHAATYTSFEGDRAYPTDGRGNKHPFQEAPSATRHIEEVRSDFDELLILPFRATNTEPFPFEWVNEEATRRDYTSLLVRISDLYEDRF
jgi:hypothetical protein